MKKILILMLFLGAFALNADALNDAILNKNISDTTNLNATNSNQSNTDTNESNIAKEDFSVFALVQKYVSLEEDLRTLNEKSDNNESVFSSEKNALKVQKKALLLEFPNAISAQKVDEKFVNAFFERKKICKMS